MANTNVKQQIIDKLKDSNNVLVTVSCNPSVDELSAALGITLLLNKLSKHATAVFSGAVPPAIEFLEPEKTFESTVDSLRDFIIALDKEKADHLRYKVVDDMVKIFITPYRTTISEQDLDFSQGDYNVEIVLALGVKTEDDLDRALQSHGRILHDATVAAISLGESTSLGGIEWVDKNASSYSEMLVAVADGLKSDKNLIDEQIATAFLTGIVAATERFSNNRTSSNVMTAAAQLMAAGANQQLIATKLQTGGAQSVSAAANGDLKEGEAAMVSQNSDAERTQAEDAATGALSISHVPEGDVDAVTKLTATEKSEQAIDRAEAELAKQTAEVSVDKQADAAREAENELADNLARQGRPPSESTLSGERHGTDQELAEPLMGGILNATTEQAAVEKQHEIDDDRNRTILSHGGGSYVSGEPIFQASLNAASKADISEPTVPDILAEGAMTQSTDHAAAIQPPAPQASVPTLAEIDAQNRVHQETAMAAVTAALTGQSEVAAPQMIENQSQSVVTGSIASSLPPLPPAPSMPPMPDFSTLPPLPSLVQPQANTVSDMPTLGDTLPPTGPIGSGPVPGSPVDPAQFRIPGQ